MLFCSGCETSYATGARFCARCGRQLAELPELLRNLEEQVARFKAWADAYPRPLAERSGYWECDYEDWNAVYDAVIPFVAATTCEQWSVPTTRLVLYILARDNEFGQVAYELRKKPNTLVCVAQRALELADTDADAKWQLAVELSRVGWLSQQVEALLLAFAQGPDEYVRRRALVALADLGAPLAAGFIESAWNSGDEYHRMAVLHALKALNSPLLDEYLISALADGRQYLAGYAARLRAGGAET
jgi:hypothetical protein